MIDTRTAPYALFILRVALGVMFIAHALLKYVVFTMPGFAGFLSQIGYPAALAWPVFLVELLGGVALVVGIWPRAVALLLTPVLIGATLVHAGNGWLFTNANGGWEYPLFLVVAGLAVVLGGDGAFALKPTPVPGSAGAQLTPRTA
jgi:putative oxidoreductase